MDQWNRCMQPLIDEIDACIRDKQDEALTLRMLSQKFGYSESHFSRNFRRVSGMRLRDYLRFRRLAFALAPLREGRQPIVQIALDAGFSSHEAFARAFQAAYGITPGQYRSHPAPVALHTILRPFDVATESGLVEEKMERAMRDFAMPGVRLDPSPGRLFYFYYDGSRGWKYVRPVTKAAP